MFLSVIMLFMMLWILFCVFFVFKCVSCDRLMVLISVLNICVFVLQYLFVFFCGVVDVLVLVVVGGVMVGVCGFFVVVGVLGVVVCWVLVDGGIVVFGIFGMLLGWIFGVLDDEFLCLLNIFFYCFVVLVN